jgi:hypothetical protein
LSSTPVDQSGSGVALHHQLPPPWINLLATLVFLSALASGSISVVSVSRLQPIAAAIYPSVWRGALAGEMLKALANRENLAD